MIPIERRENSHIPQWRTSNQTNQADSDVTFSRDAIERKSQKKD